MNTWWSENAPFIDPFGVHHFIYIFVILSLLIILLINKHKIKLNRGKIANIVLTVSILQQVLLYGWYIFETGFNVSESLPLHISRITTILGILFLITKQNRLMDIIFFFGLFAYGSFFYPDRVFGIDHAMGLSFLVNHAITLLLPYFAYIAFDWRPHSWAVIKAYGVFLVYFTVVYMLNPLIDGNYFYLKYRPFLQDLPEAIYVPILLLVTLSGFLVGHFVLQAIMKRNSKHSSHHESKSFLSDNFLARVK